MWLTWCLNQPIYQNYLASGHTTSQLIRVGLKQLANTPLAPIPKDFPFIAQHYLKALAAHNQHLESLFQLRKLVNQWVKSQLSDIYPQLEAKLENHRWQWFKPSAINNQWTIAATEQQQFSHQLKTECSAMPLDQLASINPIPQNQSIQSGAQILRISDLNDHFSIQQNLSNKSQSPSRTHKRPLQQYDTLVSMFVLDSKVAFIPKEPNEVVLPSEQLVTLCFNQYQGAYALLLETSLIQGQLRRLATGTMQRFVQPSALKSVMMPKLNGNLARRWHQQLIQILDNRQQALARMAELTPKIQALFEQQHNINQHQATHKMGATS